MGKGNITAKKKVLTPAEAISPRAFTMARITRNDSPTSKSCRAIGVPKRTMRRRIGFSMRMSLFENENGSVRRLSTSREISTLTVWDKIMLIGNIH